MEQEPNETAQSSDTSAEYDEDALAQLVVDLDILVDAKARYLYLDGPQWEALRDWYADTYIFTPKMYNNHYEFSRQAPHVFMVSRWSFHTHSLHKDVLTIIHK